MKTPSASPVIEPVPGEDGQFYARIDGVDFPDIKSPYKNVVRRKATQYIEAQAEKVQRLLWKEVGL